MSDMELNKLTNLVGLAITVSDPASDAGWQSIIDQMSSLADDSVAVRVWQASNSSPNPVLLTITWDTFIAYVRRKLQYDEADMEALADLTRQLAEKDAAIERYRQYTANTETTLIERLQELQQALFHIRCAVSAMQAFGIHGEPLDHAQAFAEGHPETVPLRVVEVEEWEQAVAREAVLREALADEYVAELLHVTTPRWRCHNCDGESTESAEAIVHSDCALAQPIPPAAAKLLAERDAGRALYEAVRGAGAASWPSVGQAIDAYRKAVGRAE